MAPGNGAVRRHVPSGAAASQSFYTLPQPVYVSLTVEEVGGDPHQIRIGDGADENVVFGEAVDGGCRGDAVDGEACQPCVRRGMDLTDRGDG